MGCECVCVRMSVGEREKLFLHSIFVTWIIDLHFWEDKRHSNLIVWATLITVVVPHYIRTHSTKCLSIRTESKQTSCRCVWTCTCGCVHVCVWVGCMCAYALVFMQNKSFKNSPQLRVSTPYMSEMTAAELSQLHKINANMYMYLCTTCTCMCNCNTISEVFSSPDPFLFIEGWYYISHD